MIADRCSVLSASKLYSYQPHHDNSNVDHLVQQIPCLPTFPHKSNNNHTFTSNSIDHVPQARYHSMDRSTSCSQLSHASSGMHPELTSTRLHHVRHMCHVRLAWTDKDTNSPHLILPTTIISTGPTQIRISAA